MVINPDKKYKKIELLTKTSFTSADITKIEYIECWGEIKGDYLFITTFNGTGNSFTIKPHSIDLITAIKLEY